MTANAAYDPNEDADPTMEEVAAELTKEMGRSAENALPPALARRLVELGENEVARRKLTPRAMRPAR